MWDQQNSVWLICFLLNDFNHVSRETKRWIIMSWRCLLRQFSSWNTSNPLNLCCWELFLGQVYYPSRAMFSDKAHRNQMCFFCPCKVWGEARVDVRGTILIGCRLKRSNHQSARSLTCICHALWEGGQRVLWLKGRQGGGEGGERMKEGLESSVTLQP